MSFYFFFSGATAGGVTHDGSCAITSASTLTATSNATLLASYSSSPATFWHQGESKTYNIEVFNLGTQLWNATGLNIVRLGVHFGTASDFVGVGWDTDYRFVLPHNVASGSSAIVSVTVSAPAVDGTWILRHRLVKEGITWFSQIQKTTVVVAHAGVAAMTSGSTLAATAAVSHNGISAIASASTLTATATTTAGIEAPVRTYEGITYRVPLISDWDYTPTGTTYWVSTTGSNGDDGLTEGTAFLTISYALTIATTPGDCIYVLPGEYIGKLAPPASGTLGNPITLSCAPGGLDTVTVKVSQAESAADINLAVFTFSSRNYFTVNGIIFEGYRDETWAPAADHFGQNGITISNGVGLRITNCVTAKNAHCGIKAMDHGESPVVVEGCISCDNGTNSLDHGIYFPSDGHTANGNTIFGNAAWGLHLYSTPADLTITRNLVFGNVGGIILGGADGVIHNNTVANHSYEGITYFRGGCLRNDVKNNIVSNCTLESGYDNGGGLLGDPTDNVDDFNDYYPDGVGIYLDVYNTVGANDINAAPLFLDEDGSGGIVDYRLQAGSPCVSAGENGVDMGCFVSSAVAVQSAITSRSTLAATATVQHKGISAIASTSTLAATSTVSHKASASMSAATTVVIGTSNSKLATVSMGGSSTVNAAGTVSRGATASITSASTVNAAGSVSRKASSAITSASTVTATATLSRGARASITAASTVSIDGDVFSRSKGGKKWQDKRRMPYRRMALR